MITILIFLLAGIAVAIYQTYDSGFYDGAFEYIFHSLFGAIFGGLIGIAIAFMLPMKTTDKHYTINLEALQDSNGISGRFFLGSGQVDGKMKYVFYSEDNGLFKLEELDADLVHIKYTSGKPIINVTENYPTKSFINYFAIDGDAFDKTYVIEVPKGTIQGGYNLDAK